MGSNTPKYAILSHTWETDEISFQEMQIISKYSDHPSRKKLGYIKIRKTCEKAKSNGIAYAWVDTCCIDKTSSAELSEAINSMYRWYQKAEVCYALLRDFDAGLIAIKAGLPLCRWFTRGWCLQELIAPQIVEFFDVHWNFIGSKAALTSQISKITQIDQEVLIDNRLVSRIPVARKMSWAAGRQTTQTEDLAYCLLGIFDVNMPMLYGEGAKAFMRLQEEIIKKSNDLSIFAFHQGSKSYYPDDCPDFDPSQPFCDLFATSPHDFIGCGGVVSAGTDVSWNNAFALTNKGVHFRRARLQVDVQHGWYNMPLNCKISGLEDETMRLRKVGPSLFARYDTCNSTEIVGQRDPDNSEDCTEVEDVYIITEVKSSIRPQLTETDQYAIHISANKYQLSKALEVLQPSVSSDRWDISRMMFLTKGERLFEGYLKVFPNLARKLVEIEDGHQSPSVHFYLVCGLDHRGNVSDPQAWVRLYSSEEWRALEKELGIVTNLSKNLSKEMGTMNANYLSDRLVLGKGSTNTTIITAIIKPGTVNGRPRFELELGFRGETAAGLTPKPTLATPVAKTAAEDVPADTKLETEGSESREDKTVLAKQKRYVRKSLIKYSFR